MAHFFAPDRRTDGYYVDGKLAPDSVWRMRIPTKQRRTIGLWGGQDLTVSSNNPAIVPNDGFGETMSRADGLRMLSLLGQAPGVAKLETRLGLNLWCTLEVEVYDAASQDRLGKIILIGGITADAAGTQANLLREIYRTGNENILETARQMMSEGKTESEVARWIVDARNNLKLAVRNEGPVLFKKFVEYRNVIKYKGNPLGPTYEMLLAEGKSDTQIIAGITKTSEGFNTVGGKLRFIGTVGEVVGFAFMATQNSPAELPPLPTTEKEQVEIEATRLRLHIPAGANIDRHGHLKKGSYLQIDTFDPHVGDEMASETEEILWAVGVSITYHYNGVVWTVPGRW